MSVAELSSITQNPVNAAVAARSAALKARLGSVKSDAVSTGNDFFAKWGADEAMGVTTSQSSPDAVRERLSQLRFRVSQVDAPGVPGYAASLKAKETILT